MRTALLSAFLFLAPASGGFATAPQEEDPAKLLQKSLEGTGLQLDLEAGVVSVPVQVLVRSDLLEYLLVGKRGAVHESLFSTEVKPSLLNAALLALGCQAGTNARVKGAEPHEIIAPTGGEASGLYLHVAWREAGETYLYRIEDLLTNLETGRAMRRHRWIFLGSRFASLREGEPKSFVADLEENLINVSFFYQGNTLLTAALEECVQQTIWAPNAWLIPPRQEELSLVFSRRRLAGLPEGWDAKLPVVTAPSKEGTTK